MNLLEIHAVGKRFPGVTALSNVSFNVASGEVHAIVGENGAGKSTLMNILSGVYTDYEGEILMDGKALVLRGPQDAERHGIATIHQELNLVGDLNVVENIFLGNEIKTRLGILDTRTMADRAAGLLNRLQLDIDSRRMVRSLRVGEQQVVEIAKALQLESRLLILDEPTSSLTDQDREHLFGVVEGLKRDGVTMIYISHKLDEVFRLADRITVLRDGEHIGTMATSEVNERQLISMMVGRELNELYSFAPHSGEGELLRVEDLGLTTGQRALSNISFKLKRGEVLGVAGLMGAGRTELLETLYGVYSSHSTTGTISVNGSPASPMFSSPAQALTAGLALVTEDRKTRSLVMGLSVGQNISLAALGRFIRCGLIQPHKEDESVSRAMRQLRVKASSADVEISTLSGGNQQKAVLAKCLLTEPDILLLDEPTRGIDVGAKAEMYSLIAEFAASRKGIIVASSELPELIGLCDRILVLADGAIAAQFDRGNVTQEQIITAAARPRLAG